MIEMKKNPIRPCLQDRIFNITVYVILSIAILLVLYPLYFMCIASISDPNAIFQGRVILIPQDYKFIGGINIAKSAKGFTPAQNQ